MRAPKCLRLGARLAPTKMQLVFTQGTVPRVPVNETGQLRRVPSYRSRLTGPPGGAYRGDFGWGGYCPGGFCPRTAARPGPTAVFQIKGAPCVHDFNAVCMILKAVHPACTPISQTFSVYLNSVCALDLNSGCTHFPPSAASGCTNLNLNFEHWTEFGSMDTDIERGSLPFYAQTDQGHWRDHNHWRD